MNIIVDGAELEQQQTPESKIEFGLWYFTTSNEGGTNTFHFIVALFVHTSLMQTDP